MNTKKLFAFGSITYDLIQNHKGDLRYCIGGSGAYFSLASNITGLKTYPVGFISDDIDKSERERLSKILDFKYLKQGKKLNFHIVYDKNLNANYLKDLNEDDEIIDYKELPKNRYIHVCVISNIKNQIEIIEHYKKINSFVSSGTYLIRIKKDREKVLKVLNMCDLFFLNEEEAYELSKKDSFEELVKFFREKGNRIVITLGKEGALYIDKEKIVKVNSIKVDIVDVTGAGETFAGGFVASYILNKDALLSLKYGVVLSSFVIEDFGVNRLINLDRNLILKRMEEVNVYYQQ